MINNKKKFLVTGGTGFIGSNIVRKLLSLGHFVSILDNNSRGKKNNLIDIQDELEFFIGDIRDKEVIIEASKNTNCIIHLAYINGTKNFYEKPYEILDVAVKGMTNVLDSMDVNDISNLILASSSEVYQQPLKIPTDENITLSVQDVFNPRNSYGGGKIISELLSINYARSRNKKVLIFRPHNVYGPNMGYDHVIPEFYQAIFPQLNNKEIFLEIQGSGNETRSFIFIDDFIKGFEILLNSGKNNNIYNIGTQNELSINELIKIISKVIGKKINIINKEIQTGSTLRRCPDITKLQALGFVPKIEIEDGIRQTFLWYSKNTSNKL